MATNSQLVTTNVLSCSHILSAKPMSVYFGEAEFVQLLPLLNDYNTYDHISNFLLLHWRWMLMTQQQILPIKFGIVKTTFSNHSFLDHWSSNCKSTLGQTYYIFATFSGTQILQLGKQLKWLTKGSDTINVYMK